MKKRRRAPQEIETTGSAFFDLFESAEAERLSIQSGLALALEREIAARQWTQAEAARRADQRRSRGIVSVSVSTDGVRPEAESNPR